MSKSICFKNKTHSETKEHVSNEKFNTDLFSRSKSTENFKAFYYSTPSDKFKNKKILRFCDKHTQREPSFQVCFQKLKHESCIPQFEYLRNNLCIKTRIGTQDGLQFQMKKISFRNYTPKILNQEMNMGMWI